MNIKDLRIDTYRNSSPTVSMRIVHERTGVTVEGTDTSTYKLKERLLKEIELKVNAVSNS